MQLTTTEVGSATDIVRVLEAFGREPYGGLVAPPSNVTSVHRGLILALVAHHLLPAVFPYRYFAAEGGLMSYGVDLNDLFRRSAVYVDRILKGGNPGELPVEAPTKFALVLNLKTAKALGLAIPPRLLVMRSSSNVHTMPIRTFDETVRPVFPRSLAVGAATSSKGEARLGGSFRLSGTGAVLSPQDGGRDRTRAVTDTIEKAGLCGRKPGQAHKVET